MKSTAFALFIVLSLLWTSVSSFPNSANVPGYIYRNLTGSGTEGPTSQRQYFGMATINGSVIILGGKESNQDSTTKDSWSFRVNDSTWARYYTDPLPFDGYGHCFAQNGSIVYIFGGNSKTSHMLIWNLTSGFIQNTSAPTPSNHTMFASCGIFRDHVVIFGGCDISETSCTSDILFFNASQGQFWTPSTSGVPPSHSRGSSMVIATIHELTKPSTEKEHYAVVFGGESSTTNGEFYQFNLVNLTWHSMEFKTPFHSAYQQAVVTESNTILIFGGRNMTSNKLMTDSFAFNFTNGTVTQLYTTSPLPPRTGHSVIYVDKTVLIYGGNANENPKEVWELIVEAECSSRSCGECILSHSCIWCNPNSTSPYCVAGNLQPYIESTCTTKEGWYHDPQSCRIDHKAPVWLVATTIITLVVIVTIVVATYLVDRKKGRDNGGRYEPI